jgi:hypothetical protein
VKRMTHEENDNVEVVLSLERIGWRDGVGQVHVGTAVAYANVPVYLVEVEGGVRQIVSASAIHRELWPHEVTA